MVRQNASCEVAHMAALSGGGMHEQLIRLEFLVRVHVLSYHRVVQLIQTECRHLYIVESAHTGSLAHILFSGFEPTHHRHYQLVNIHQVILIQF